MPLQFPYPYIICLQTNTLFFNYKPLEATLEASPNWWHYMPNVWLAFRYESLGELQAVLAPLIHQTNDRLLILPAKGPAAGWLPQDAWEWLNKYLPKEWGGPPPDYSWLTSGAQQPATWRPPAWLPPNSLKPPGS